MLVLARSVHGKTILTVPPSTTEQVIEVTVVRIQGDKVKLGFQAEKCVSIHRDDAGRKHQSPDQARQV